MSIYINKFFNQVFKMKNAGLIIDLIVLKIFIKQCNTINYWLVSKKEGNAEGLFVPSML